MKFWTPERDEQLRRLWVKLPVLRLDDIAKEIGISGTYCSARASHLRLNNRFAIRRAEKAKQTQQSNPPMARSSIYMIREAQRRGVSVAQLISRIMRVINEDKMVNAILDDDVPEVEAPKMTDGGTVLERA